MQETRAVAKETQHLIIHLVRIGEVDSLEVVGDEVVNDGGSVHYCEELMPAYSLQEHFLVPEAQTAPEAAVARDMLRYTRQTEVLECLHHTVRF